MLARANSYVLLGLQAIPIEVEVDAGPGLPQLQLVGLPDQAVREARERVRSAIANSGFRLPSLRLTVNLAPADVRKQGGIFDLAIALGILAATRQLEPESLTAVAALVELALDGSLRPIRGVLAIALGMRPTHRKLLLPSDNAAEAAAAC